MVILEKEIGISWLLHSELLQTLVLNQDYEVITMLVTELDGPCRAELGIPVNINGSV